MDFTLALYAAFCMGLMTTVSPCAVATNMAAMSFVASQVHDRKILFLSGVLYTLGRSLTYAVTGFLLVGAMISIPTVSVFLSLYINKLFGVFLILVGMYLLKLLPVKWAGLSVSDSILKKIAGLGILSPLLLGVIFALAFCPVATALFFGSLIPLAVKVQSSVALPAAYGLGTGLPVLAFSLLLAGGVQYAGKVRDRITRAGNFLKSTAGLVFIAAGIYYILKYI